MADKLKYPIGTKIRFIYPSESGRAHLDNGKTGMIVGYDTFWKRPIIFLPTGTKKFHLRDGSPYTWKCTWAEIEPTGQRQLLFNFMYE